MADAMTLQDWLDKLRPAETPVFAHTKRLILNLQSKTDNLTAREIAAPILTDPLATLRLIYTANNRTSRHFSNDVATVEHAIMMQGVGAFMEKVQDFPIVEKTDLAQHHKCMVSLYRLLRLAQHAAWQARDFAVLHSDIRAEEVQVAALLYYAPEFLFWLDAPEIALKLAQLRRKMPSAEAEQKALGFELTPLRLMLLEEWKIPELTRDLLDPNNAQRSRQAILRACFDIANHSHRGWWDPKIAAAFETLAGIEHTPPDLIVATAHSNAVRVARAGTWIPAAPAAAWLPMLPGSWPEEPDEEAPPQADHALPPAGSTAASKSDESCKDLKSVRTPATTTAPACPTPDKAAFKETLMRLGSNIVATQNLNQVTALMLKGLHTGLGLSRILFAMVTPDGKQVKCRFTLGISAQDPLRHFAVDLGSRDFFGQVMSKMQGVWMNAENRQKLWPMLSPAMQTMIGEADFYAMSLFSGNRPVGMVYADRGHGTCNLDAMTYTDFKMLCLQGARVLGKTTSQ